MAIKARGTDQRVGELSGGTQQKVAFARVIHQEADVLLLDEPTRGIDVGTKAEIYRLIGELAAAGKAIIFVSSYLPELLAICDTLGVMLRGRLVAVRPTKDWTTEEVTPMPSRTTPLKWCNDNNLRRAEVSYDWPVEIIICNAWPFVCL